MNQNTQDKNSLSSQSSSQTGLLVVLLIAICAAALATHWPALSANATFFDDGQYLAKNQLVQNPSWDSARRFLAEIWEPSTVEGYYQPLTMLSLMADYALAGEDETLRPFHRTSLALHLLNTVLVTILLYILFGQAWVAACIGLLFGLHPMTVEPICWLGERKTMLAAFFALWSLIFYVFYARSTDWKVFLACFFMYLLAVMSKPTSIPLPLLMLLLDFWPLRRCKWAVIWEKLPLFVIGGAFAVVTYVSQSRTAAVTPPLKYSPAHIALVICHNIIFYLYKIIWPVNLTPHYAFPKPLGLSNPMVLAGVIGTCVLVGLLLISLRWTRAGLIGWLFFFIAIFPTMGVVGFTIVIASDKYAYLPSFGLMMVLAAFLSWLWGRKAASRFYLVIRMLLILVVLALASAEARMTQRYIQHWQDTIGLHEYILVLTPDAVPVHNNLGVVLKSQGRTDEAISHYHQALLIKPKDGLTHYNLGSALQSQGRLEKAVSHYRQALEYKRDSANAHNNLGIVLRLQGKLDEAEIHFKKALKAKPDYSKAHYNLANLLVTQDKLDQAVHHYRLALQAKPEYPEAHNNLGVVLKSQGKLDEAITHYRKALQQGPGGANAYCNLATALQLKGKLDEAIKYYYKALQAKPDFAKAHNNLGSVLMTTGQFDQALKHFRKALSLEPDYLTSLNGMAMILATHPDSVVHNAAKAIELAERAAELTEYRDAQVLDTLAAAYAAAGQFEEAVITAYVALALSDSDKQLANQIRERLELYRQAKPYLKLPRSLSE